MKRGKRGESEMSKLTNIGRFLRKLRIDRGEYMQDMATVLNVSASYLSSVESGRRKAPQQWANIIIDAYDLNSEMSDELNRYFIEDKQSVNVNLKNSSIKVKELSAVFARKINSLSDDDIRKLEAILAGESD